MRLAVCSAAVPAGSSVRFLRAFLLRAASVAGVRRAAIPCRRSPLRGPAMQPEVRGRRRPAAATRWA